MVVDLKVLVGSVVDDDPGTHVFFWGSCSVASAGGVQGSPHTVHRACGPHGGTVGSRGPTREDERVRTSGWGE